MGLNMGRTIAIYADCATLTEIETYSHRPDIEGITTNPSLMKAARISDYSAFAKVVLSIVPSDKCVSFEVLSDEAHVIRKQAERIAGWGANVIVKIPIMTPNGARLDELIAKLADERMAINVTAVCDIASGFRAVDALAAHGGGIVSLFAGRVADAGHDPKTFVRTMRRGAGKSVKLLWASSRQVFDVKLARNAGADIITLTPPLIQRLGGLGQRLEDVTLRTVAQFTRDGQGITWGVE